MEIEKGRIRSMNVKHKKGHGGRRNNRLGKPGESPDQSQRVFT